MLKKTSLHPVDRFDDFALAWDALNDATARLPFLSAIFMRHLIRVFATGLERIVVLEDESREQAICIVSRTNLGTWQTWQPSQLPLGACVKGPDVGYPELLAALMRALPGFALVVGVTQQDPVVSPRPNEGPRLQTLDYMETGWIDVKEPFDDYWKGRGKGLQQNMRTQRSRLSREGTPPSLEVITRRDFVADAIADFGRLESAGWKAAAGTAVHPDNEQGEFYRSALQDFAEAGMTKIYRYRFGDRVVAVDLCVESGDVQVLLKTTYDESIKGLSPSSLLRQDAYREIFNEGRIRRIEFYGPVMEWTRRWTDTWRTLYHVNVYRSAMVPRMSSAIAAVRRVLQRKKVPAAPHT